MKFLAFNFLTGLGALLLIRTLDEPLMTEAARDPLSGVVVFLVVLTPLLERWLRPRQGATSGSHVRKVMATTMIKMFAMLILILVYLFLGGPDPRVFGLGAYLVYAAFTGILVAETMRHPVPPTDPR